jgi:hypothetical protein
MPARKAKKVTRKAPAKSRAKSKKQTKTKKATSRRSPTKSVKARRTKPKTAATSENLVIGQESVTATETVELEPRPVTESANLSQ